jgi:hypothetical protein
MQGHFRLRTILLRHGLLADCGDAELIVEMLNLRSTRKKRKNQKPVHLHQPRLRKAVEQALKEGASA